MNLKYKNNDEIFIEEFDKKVPLLRPAIFEDMDWLIAGVTTRHGGVSTEYRLSLNLSDTVGDRPENILQNFTNLAETIGISPYDMVCSDQTHTTNLLMVDDSYKGQGVTRPRYFQDIDGLMTDKKGICLITTYADCVPLFFVDTKNRVVALSHSGWRGTVNQIGKVTIETMQREYGSLPENIKCCIGPSICQDCYEVSEDVILEFEKTYAPKYYPDLFYKKDNGKYQLNLWEACKITLLETGIKEENLSVTNLCTSCNNENLFSHRASHGKRGNIGTFIMIKNRDE